MPIPSQNDILVPFLEILRDGQAHTRAQLLFDLAKRFKLKEIVILTSQSEKRSMWDNDEIMGNFILSWDMRTEMNMAIKVCSIYAYRGLESSVVILSELDKLHDNVAQQLLYVGLSRARNHAVILGDLPAPRELAIDD